MIVRANWMRDNRNTSSTCYLLLVLRTHRMCHVLRPDPLVELPCRHEAQLECGLAQGEILSVRLEGDLRRLLVADVRVERCHQHERAVEVLADALLVRL